MTTKYGLLRRLLKSALLTPLLWLSVSSFAITVVPPGLAPGAQYRLAFYTSQTTVATSNDISYYNGFAAEGANAVPELAALGTQWKALVSVTGTSARDNTGTNRNSSVGVPIYNLAGQRVAANNFGLWIQDGCCYNVSIENPINVSETGAITTRLYVWSGTGNAGQEYGGKVLGTSGSDYRGRTGTAGYADVYWIAADDVHKGSALGLYVLSGVLTVPVVNTAPTANAGAAQSIHAGQTVLLDGRLSTDDNTDPASLGYAWSFFAKPVGSAATMINATTSQPSFVADKPGTYEVNLVVTDEGGLLRNPPGSRSAV